MASVLASNLDDPLLVVFEDLTDFKYTGRKVCINSPAGKNILAKALSFLYRIRKLRKIKLSERPVVSISITEGPNFVNIFSRIGEKIIISVHENKTAARGVSRLYRLLYGFLIKRSYNKATGIVCVSSGIKADLIKNFGIREDKLRVIYNPIEVSTIQAQAREAVGALESIFGKRVLCTVGRLTYQKGLWHLLRAFKNIYKVIPETKLVFVGEGDMGRYLIDLAKKLGFKVFVSSADNSNGSELGDYEIYFLGFQKNPFSIMARSSALVLPSLWEGFGYVLVEAMACGIPIIAADCPSGPREIISGEAVSEGGRDLPEFSKFGILAPLCDGAVQSEKEEITKEEVIWGDAIKGLLGSEDKIARYKLASKGRADFFDTSRVMDEWREYVGGIIN